MNPRCTRRAGSGARPLFASLLLCSVASGLALVAAPATSGAVSLLDLFAGATVVADDKLFDGWTLINLQTTNGGKADLAGIDVTPLVDDPLNPGIHFSAPVDALGTPFGHTGPSSVSLVFSFNVQTTNQLPLIKDNSLLLTDWVFDSGPLAFIQVTEEVYDVTGAQIGQKLTIARPNDFPGSGNPDHFDQAVFTPQQLVHVVKRIEIQGPGDNDGAFLTGFEQRFSQVPEPGSLVLLVLGVGALAGYGRMRPGAARR
jgi:hypothetical protein